MLSIMHYGVRIIEYVKTLKNSAQFEHWGSESFSEEDIFRLKKKYMGVRQKSDGTRQKHIKAKRLEQNLAYESTT